MVVTLPSATHADGEGGDANGDNTFATPRQKASGLLHPTYLLAAICLVVFGVDATRTMPATLRNCYASHKNNGGIRRHI